MDLTITEIPPEMAEALDERARHNGKSVEEYVRALIETDLLASRSFDEILAPVRKGFADSGMSEEELTDFIESEVKAYRAEKRTRKADG